MITPRGLDPHALGYQQAVDKLSRERFDLDVAAHTLRLRNETLRKEVEALKERAEAAEALGKQCDERLRKSTEAWFTLDQDRSAEAKRARKAEEEVNSLRHQLRTAEKQVTELRPLAEKLEIVGRGMLDPSVALWKAASVSTVLLRGVFEALADPKSDAPAVGHAVYDLVQSCAKKKRGRPKTKE